MYVCVYVILIKEKSNNMFFFINVDIWASLRMPRLIPRALKLMIMQVSSCHEVCEIRSDDL